MKRTVSADPRGFTLMEIMVTVAIIGVLVSISYPRYVVYRKTARTSQVKANLQTIRSAIITQTLISGSYPAWSDVSENSGNIVKGSIPANPFSVQNKLGQQDPKNIVYNMISAEKGVLALGGGLGWCYNQQTGDFWANTRTSGVNENDF